MATIVVFFCLIKVALCTTGYLIYHAQNMQHGETCMVIECSIVFHFFRLLR